jgi:NADPH:quinone reductase-like Zn-dependent oxidoreductase
MKALALSSFEEPPAIRALDARRRRGVHHDGHRAGRQRERQSRPSREARGLMVQGDARVPVRRTYPLSDAARALDDFTREHTVGKLVITM